MVRGTWHNLAHLAHLVVAIACCHVDRCLTSGVDHLGVGGQTKKRAKKEESKIRREQKKDLEQVGGPGEQETNNTNVPAETSQLDYK